MTFLKDIVEVVREYFDSAILIDDDLFSEMNEKQTDADAEIQKAADTKEEPFDESLLDEPGVFYDSIVETATAIENTEKEQEQQQQEQESELKEIADLTLKEFIKEGFVTYPCSYDSSQSYNYLTKMLTNGKLLIVDWNLEKSTESGYMGDAAIEFIKVFCSEKKGLKCAVIYTTEPELVSEKLGRHFTVHSRGNHVFFQKEFRENDFYLMGFVLSKKDTSPQQILEKISLYLYENKSLTIHLMDSANRLDRSLDTTISRFDIPFENILFSQLLTSDTPAEKVSYLINELLVSNVLETDLKTNCDANFMFLSKKRLIRNGLTSFEGKQEDLSYLISALSGEVNEKNQEVIRDILNNKVFIQALDDILMDDSVTTLDEFKRKMKEKVVELDIIKTPSKLDGMLQCMVLTVLLWDFYLQNGSKETFEASFGKQAYNLTVLRKFNDLRDDRNNLDTGSIYYKDNKVYLCITPFCDTFNTEKVEHNLKFIVGEKVDTPTENLLKNQSMSYYTLAVPNAQDEKIEFVRFNFYQVATYTVDQLRGEQFLKGLTLKKEYIQKVINQYIAYQSRAGVDEMFYKESQYIKNFLPIFS